MIIETQIADTHYARLIERVLTTGQKRDERTGVGAISVFRHHMDFDLGSCFPLISLKTVSWKTVWEELRWMLSGSTNTSDLDATIWDEWADENGDLGLVYGAQWRGKYNHLHHSWDRPDQIANLITGLRNDPNSRRHVVSAWNATQIADMALPPCHMMFQVFCDNDNGLSLQMYQRSCDVFLGLPYNIAGYAFLTHVLAMLTGRRARYLHITIGDAHIYSNHVDQCVQVLERHNSNSKWALFEQAQRVRLTGWTGNVRDWSGAKIDEFLADNPAPVISGYVGRGVIKGDVAV